MPKAKKKSTTFGERLAWIRKCRNVSGTGLSEEFGKSHGWISSLENKEVLTSIDMMLKLAKRLDCSFLWLAIGEGDAPKVEL